MSSLPTYVQAIAHQLADKVDVIFESTASEAHTALEQCLTGTEENTLHKHANRWMTGVIAELELAFANAFRLAQKYPDAIGCPDDPAEAANWACATVTRMIDRCLILDTGDGRNACRLWIAKAIGLPGNVEPRLDHWLHKGLGPLTANMCVQFSSGIHHRLHVLTNEAMLSDLAPHSSPKSTIDGWNDPDEPLPHSADFGVIRFQEKDYPLKPMQALLLQALYSAWEQGMTGLSGKDLKEAVKSTNDTVFKDAFKFHPLWKTLITTTEKGRKYSLNLPLKAASKVVLQ